jgi:5-formyltetrahydrofolate cyclo-ligase
MSADIHAAKRAMRLDVLGRIKEMAEAERREASARARELLAAQACWQAAKSVLFYAPLPGELDIWPLVAEAWRTGRTIGLPRFVRGTGGYEACVVRDLDTGIRLGHFGIREPAEGDAASMLKRLDLVLVPGVAFDLLGRRLGRGKGYYDRLLAKLDGTKCGVAFDQQIVHEVPVARQDQRMDCVLTPARWICV